ncbi:MAG: tyrosine-type recombinase/integrase [Bacteriovoracaceae bacterium]|nr:tyrosine-type recombinase/integrase [Bacteriovoracaceae bacterium]
MTKKQKYRKIEKGIRKNLGNGKYGIYGLVHGEKIPEKEFVSMKEAREFRKRFIASRQLTTKSSSESFTGETNEVYFGDIWEIYRRENVDSCTTTSTRQNRLDKIPFLEGLFKFKIHDISSLVISEHLENEKTKCLLKAEEIKRNVESRDAKKAKLNLPIERYSRRSNFNDDLKFLKCLFNWYRERFDDTNFGNPVLKKHKTTSENKGAGFIKLPHQKEKKMSSEEMFAFWKAFTPQNSIYHDLAVMQYYLLNRIQEPCGLQVQDISLKFKKLWIRHVCIWGQDKKFLELKIGTKNGEHKPVFLNETLIEIIERRLLVRDPECNFLFQIDGEPLNYRSVQYQYNKALKSAGLFPRFSATHFNRYSAGTAIRSLTGSLDHAQASGRWKDSGVAQGYCAIDYELQQESTVILEKHMQTHNKSQS